MNRKRSPVQSHATPSSAETDPVARESRTAPGTAPVYRKRPRYFACQFARLLTKKCVANELGPQAFTLLTVIAMTEDARGYTDPVTFYNGQLLPLIGAGSEDSLDRVRRKCVEAGWLHYVPGGRRTGPGRYWVTVPERYAGTDDAPTDEPPGAPDAPDGEANAPGLPRTGAEQTASKPRANHGANREQTAEPSSLPLPLPLSGSGTDPGARGGHAAKAGPDPPVKAKKPRPRNPLFDAIAEVTGAAPAAAGSHIAKVEKSLKAEEPPFTPEEVQEFGRRFWELCPWAAKDNRRQPELGELQKHIGKVRTTKPPPPSEYRPPKEHGLQPRMEGA